MTIRFDSADARACEECMCDNDDDDDDDDGFPARFPGRTGFPPAFNGEQHLPPRLRII